MADQDKSLTGVWNGLYSYPHALPPASFIAILIESGRFISGTTHEDGDSVGVAGIAYATLSGSRTESAVTFTKTYEGGTGHAVAYDGRINDDATEIEGTWRIQGVWSGRFLMIRSGGREETVETGVLEPADER